MKISVSLTNVNILFFLCLKAHVSQRNPHLISCSWTGLLQTPEDGCHGRSPGLYLCPGVSQTALKPLRFTLWASAVTAPLSSPTVTAHGFVTCDLWAAGHFTLIRSSHLGWHKPHLTVIMDSAGGGIWKRCSQVACLCNGYTNRSRIEQQRLESLRTRCESMYSDARPLDWGSSTST